MKILIVAFFDDNFGDMLIRTNFTQLLKVALRDLDIAEYSIDAVHLRDADEEAVKSADLILFPGGGLFGLSYLQFFDPLKNTLDLAEAYDVPVVFSSIGVNNMDANEENEEPLRELLKKKCIRSVSVREDLELFRYYCQEPAYDIRLVCDPAVWSKYTYAADLPERKDSPTEGPAVIGINAVRGGLFKANGVDWALPQEEEYLQALALALEQEGLDYRFFTNGSVTDCNSLLTFADHCEIPPEKVILPETTRELVQTVYGFDAVAAIRMHASITAYAMGIPVINLIWNPKIPHFYQNIGFPDRAIELEHWNAEELRPVIRDMLAEEGSGKAEADYPSEDYLMSLYRYIYQTMKDLFRPSCDRPPMEFADVCAQLAGMRVPEEEDVIDLRMKVAKAEVHTQKLSANLQNNKETIRTLREKRDLMREKRDRMREKRDRMKEKRDRLKEKLQDSQEKVKKLEEQRDRLKEKNQKLTQKNEKLSRELERINNKAVVRAYRAIRGTSKKK